MIEKDRRGSKAGCYNAPLHDSELDLAAKGLYAQIVSVKDQGWTISVDGLTALAQNSRNTTWAIIQRLKQEGYLQVEEVRNEQTGAFEKAIYKLFSDPKHLTQGLTTDDYAEPVRGNMWIDISECYEAHFTLIPAAIFKDNTVRYEAKGLYAILSSLPGNFKGSTEDIARLYTRTGRDGVRSAMRELEEHGYITRRQDNKTGYAEAVYTMQNDPHGLTGRKYTKKEPLKKYGDYGRVGLTETEYKQLKKKYGEKRLAVAISMLDGEKCAQKKRALRGKDWGRITFILEYHDIKETDYDLMQEFRDNRRDAEYYNGIEEEEYYDDPFATEEGWW